MASKRRKRLTAAEQRRRQAKQAIDQLQHVDVPRGKPKGALRRLRHELHNTVQKAGDRVKAIRRRIAGSKGSPQLAMFDDVTVSLIPRDAKAAAGYVGGLYTTWPQIEAGPWPYKLSIAINAGEVARCLDVEAGDATIDQAPGWFRTKADRSHGKPVLYTSVSNLNALVAAMTRAGIRREEYLVWSAHYTFGSHRCSASCWPGLTTTAEATQWTDRANGESLDESNVAAGFWA